MVLKARLMLVPESKWGLKCPYPIVAEHIVVHNTANDASANNEISYMRTNNTSTSFHFAIDDKEVVMGLPLNRNGFHAGDGSNGAGNRKGIGIEICYSKSGGARFVQAEKNAAIYIAQLLRERGWGVSRVKKHQDFSGKYCPHRTLDLGWQRFLGMVQAELNRLNKPTEPPAPIEPTTPVWQAMTTPRKLTNPAEVNLIDLIADKKLATYKVGEVFDFDQWTKFKGIVWVRTAYSSANKLDRGFIFDRLSEVKKPEAESSPEPAEPPAPQEPEPPTEPPVEPPVPPTLPQPPNILELLRQLLKSILNWIKGDR